MEPGRRLTLGTASAGRELFHLNQGRAQPQGDSLQHPRLIRPGWTLVFPPGAVGLSESPVNPSPVNMPGPVELHAQPDAPNETAAIEAFPAHPSDGSSRSCPNPSSPTAIAAPDAPHPPADAGRESTGKPNSRRHRRSTPRIESEPQPPPLHANDHPNSD